MLKTNVELIYLGATIYLSRGQSFRSDEVTEALFPGHGVLEIGLPLHHELVDLRVVKLHAFEKKMEQVSSTSYSHTVLKKT